MLSRNSIGRSAHKALRQQWQPASRRAFAAPASGSFQYESGDARGVKFASRDMSGPTSQLAIVSKAGTRYEPLPGLTLSLRAFAFKNTQKRSALRIQRESELLGSELYTQHSRENLLVGAKFLRDDLPYFVELLAEVASQTKYLQHVFHEDVEHIIHLHQQKYLANVKEMAIDSAHGLAFHRGLGVPVLPAPSVPLSKYLDADVVSQFASSAYSKPNFAVVANGVESGELNKWVGQFFTDVPSQSSVSLESPKTKYFGGEERIAHAGPSAMVLAFSGSSLPTGDLYKPEISVLAALLGGQSTIKWSPGFSLLSKAGSNFPGAQIETTSNIYSDAGLVTVALSGAAKDVAGAAAHVVKTLEQVSQGLSTDDFQKARALAKFKELEFGQNIYAGLELTGSGLINSSKPYQIDEVAKGYEAVTEESVKAAAKAFLESKASVASVGDLYALPYAADIGLQV